MSVFAVIFRSHPLRMHFSILVLLLAIMWSSPVAEAQPSLDVKRIVVNWPTIELYFIPYCDSTGAWGAGKDSYRIVEDGEEISDFTLWCPDPVHNPISVALVMDASGSMVGPRRDAVIAGGRTFVNTFDSTSDEATIVYFDDKVTIQQKMTTDKSLLYSALGAYPIGGSSTIWDGAYAGIIELVNNGVNQTRSVILVSDGSDQGSLETFASVLTLAGRNRIPIHTICIDAAADTSSLKDLSVRTGGRYYYVEDVATIPSIYQDINDRMRESWGFAPCVITYERTRPDGTLRTVDLTFKDFCDSSVTETLTYHAPRFPESMLATECTDSVRLSYDAQSGLYAPNPFTISIPYRNMSSMTLSNLLGSVSSMSPDIVLAPGSVGAQLHTGGFLDPWQTGDTITSFSWEFMFAGVPPCLDETLEIEFSLFALDTSQTAVEVFCTTLVFLEGVSPELGPFQLGMDGSTELCQGDSLILDAGSGHALYFWSTGATTQSIVVKESGSYFCEALLTTCSRGMSDTITVTVFPAAFKPAVMRDRDVLRSTEAHAYQWLRNGLDIPGATDRTFQLSETGTYQIKVTNEYGCSEISDPYEVTVLSVDATRPEAFRLDVYPQPAHDLMTVHAQNISAGAVVIAMYDRLGRRILHRDMESHDGVLFQQLDVSGWSPGVYFLELRTRTVREYKVLVIE